MSDRKLLKSWIFLQSMRYAFYLNRWISTGFCMFYLGKPNTLCIATHIAQICKHMWFLDPACSCMHLFSQALVLKGIQGFPIRVIQIGQKWQTLHFSTFLARFRIFWKMMFGKMQKIFWLDHSNACRKCSKVLLHNAPMWNGAKQKIQFFQFFQ